MATTARWPLSRTCGAALPIVETLQQLVRTGDRATRVEGSFSGTLGYLCDALMQGVPIDRAVRQARASGFTEPRPQEDLAGTDAARKALILAREMGLEHELEQVAIEPLVPAELLAIDEVEAFLEALGRGVNAEEAAQLTRGAFAEILDVPAWKRDFELAQFDRLLERTRTWVAQTRGAFELVGVEVPVHVTDRIYGAMPGAVIEQINAVEQIFDFDVRTLLVIGHEPTMSALALGLAGAPGTNATAAEHISTKYPTSAMAVLRIDGPWSSVELGSAALTAFHIPR